MSNDNAIARLWKLQAMVNKMVLDGKRSPEGVITALQAIIEEKPATPPSIIRVDRSVRPPYPDWVKEVKHPELEGTGPVEYNAREIKLWLHPEQERGTVRGEAIYKHLKEEGALPNCLGLADLLAVQAKGITFYRKHFAEKVIFGWRSVVQSRDGYLLVPFLYVHDDAVELYWDWLDREWYSLIPAARFAR